MSYKVLLPQPILPEGYAYLRDHGYEVVDGRGFAGGGCAGRMWLTVTP